MKQVRCAIYTRKSSEEGLEQDFNSLHAQREACSAYVLSQASEGWTALADEYDDGGLSGGSLERPALQRLLQDIASGGVDIIVVYKVDRLTRSLLDFAKLVEAFDRAGVSFVSVTQSFNTTTSMGRLTLNMLLSFAQFEREVTAERIRDKIAASKARGMWMGGTPPLGYAPDGRTLKIVEDQADLVRSIYERYRSLGNVRLLADRLRTDGVITPVRIALSGKTFGGCEFSRGHLYAILRNPIYVGDIVHRGKVHAGNQQPIIERDMWDTVQTQLANNTKGVRRSREANASLLAGRLFDEAGQPLIPVHTRKGTRRYRYYVSKSLHHAKGQRLTPPIRMPATDIEQVVSTALAEQLVQPVDLLSECGIEIPPTMLAAVLAKCETMAAGAAKRGPSIVRALVERVEVHPSFVQLSVNSAALTTALALNFAQQSPAPIKRRLAVALSRTGRAMRLIDESGVAATASAADEKLARLVVRARQWWRELETTGNTVSQLAMLQGVTSSYMTRVLRLAFLSPDVVSAIVTGALRTGIDASHLFGTKAISGDWTEQRKSLLPALYRPSWR